MAKQNKNRGFPHDLEDHQQPPKKTTTSLYSFLSEFAAEPLSPESLSYFEAFLRPLVREIAERKVEAYFNLPRSSSSNQVHHQTGEGAVGAGSGSGTVKLKLCFLNNIPPNIFTNNQVQAENAQPLRLGLCDTTNNVNNVIALEATHPFSSALIEFVVLDGDFVSAQQREDGVPWTVAEFNKSVLPEREGQRPSLVGNDKTTRLKDGIAFIGDLSFTQNSSRTRTKMVRLGVRIKDHEILAKYPRIGEAVSNPFRVKDQRGEANKKHHPPEGEDEVYRLEGIRKDGERHKSLSSKGIETVEDFVKAYEEDPRSLRKLLGKKLSDKTWNEMVKHASEYVPSIPTFDPFAHILVGNEVMEAEDFDNNLQVNDQNIIHPTTNGLGFAETTFFPDNFNHIFGYHPSLLSRGEASTSNTHNYEVENTNTYNQYFQGARTQPMQMDGQNR